MAGNFTPEEIAKREQVATRAKAVEEAAKLAQVTELKATAVTETTGDGSDGSDRVVARDGSKLFEHLGFVFDNNTGHHMNGKKDERGRPVCYANGRQIITDERWEGTVPSLTEGENPFRAQFSLGVDFAINEDPVLHSVKWEDEVLFQYGKPHRGYRCYLTVADGVYVVAYVGYAGLVEAIAPITVAETNPESERFKELARGSAKFLGRERKSGVRYITPVSPVTARSTEEQVKVPPNRSARTASPAPVETVAEPVVPKPNGAVDPDGSARIRFDSGPKDVTRFTRWADLMASRFHHEGFLALGPKDAREMTIYYVAGGDVNKFRILPVVPIESK
jgi:hypothetical protein